MNKGIYDHITDQELLERYYNDRSNEWLGSLLHRYTLLLFGVCMKYLKNEEEAKDAVQQIFLKVITELPKYKVSYFKSWIYMIARNHCLMKLRNNPAKSPVDPDQIAVASDESYDRVKSLAAKDRELELLESSLNDLAKEQKLCVTLFYLEKKSYQQITDATGYTLMQVKSYIQNGKRNLRLLLDKKIKEG